MQGSVRKYGSGTLTLSSNASTYNSGQPLRRHVERWRRESGTTGPLGSMMAGAGVYWNGGILQYSSVNNYDYSPYFNNGAGVTIYSVDTNGQNVTWASALTSALAPWKVRLRHADALIRRQQLQLRHRTLRRHVEPWRRANGNTRAAGLDGAWGWNLLERRYVAVFQRQNYDYSPYFSNAAGRAYNVDTNGQNVTWATALTSSGGSLTKSGSGTLTLTAANTYTRPHHRQRRHARLERRRLDRQQPHHQ